jgi:Autographiviridae endonuclease VII
MKSEAAKRAGRSYYERNKQACIDRAAKWNALNVKKRAEIGLKSQLKRLYGITVERYYSMLFVQKSRCAVCSRAFGKLAQNRPHVEHNHKTGKVRGLCCSACNVRLGVLESPLRPALEEYLKRTA